MNIKAFILLPAVMFLAVTGCSIFGVVGSGNIVTRTYNDSNFAVVYCAGIENITVKTGTNYEISITADDNLLSNISVSVTTNVLMIEDDVNLIPTRDIEVVITMPYTAGVAMLGTGKFSNTGVLVTTNFLLTSIGTGPIFLNISNTGTNLIFVSGTGPLTLTGNAGIVQLNMTGTGNAYFSGTASDLNLTLTGTGTAYLTNMTCPTADISLTGTGNAWLNVSSSIDGVMTGTGSLYYRGNPVVNVTRTGTGSVNRI